MDFSLTLYSSFKHLDFDKIVACRLRSSWRRKRKMKNEGTARTSKIIKSFKDVRKHTLKDEKSLSPTLRTEETRTNITFYFHQLLRIKFDKIIYCNHQFYQL